RSAPSADLRLEVIRTLERGHERVDQIELCRLENVERVAALAAEQHVPPELRHRDEEAEPRETRVGHLEREARPLERAQVADAEIGHGALRQGTQHASSDVAVSADVDRPLRATVG